MPLLERVRVEVYIPDIPSSQYQNLLRSFEEELTYAFGGSTILGNLEGSYLSEAGDCISDRVNLIYSDLPLALSTNFDSIALYVGALKDTAMEALMEEAVLISVEQFITRSSCLRVNSIRSAICSEPQSTSRTSRGFELGTSNLVR